ncbi:MAG: Dipeptidyl-peptidase 6 [Dehalococcoidia bacterium]|nr:Dipeptidyl-peptidase 6 [Chloroflexota bacterium]
MPSRSEVVQAARAYIGTPYHHQGRSRAGLDCVGLIVAVAADIGLQSHAQRFDIQNYSRMPDGSLMTHFGQAAEAVLGKPQPGDILVFKFLKQPHHLAIQSGPSRMVHAVERYGVVEVNLVEQWLARQVGVYQLPGVL